MPETHAFEKDTLKLTASVGSDPDSLIKGNFDIAFVFPSWDHRCKSVIGCAAFSTSEVVEVRYANSGKTQSLLKNRDKLLSFFQSINAQHKIVAVSNEQFRSTCEMMRSHIEAKANEQKRALRVFVDLSTASRIYALSLVAFGIRSGLVRSFEFLYAEGEYRKAEELQSEIELFTGGKWEAIAIPGLEGEFVPGQPYNFVVSLGFEGAKTLRVLNNAEPNRVAALLPSPGFNESYEKKMRECNKALLATYVKDQDCQLLAEAGNPVAASLALERLNFESDFPDNTFYLCCGTKPHSLALCIRAISLGHPTVLYNKPVRHMENATVPSGRYWHYVLVDRAVY